MQTVSPEFVARTSAKIRPLSYRVLISFEKVYDPTIDWFSIGESTIGGSDPLKGEYSVIQNWDQYLYTDYSDRVISVEYNRQSEPPTSPLTLANCDIVFDNHDDLFTPSNADSPLDGFILPRRPIRLYLGFGGELIPIMVGLTEKPVIDERGKTARFHAVDFLSAIANISLDEELMFIDYRTDQIISEVLQSAGLSTAQISLDTGGIIIPFAYFKKGTNVGQALSDVAEAELGNIHLSEAGVVNFENRASWSDNTNVWNFDQSNVIEKSTPTSDQIINQVKVYSNARTVRANQSLWELVGGREVPGNSSIEIIADFRDQDGDLPVVSADDPDYIDSAATSKYATNEFEDGSGDTLESQISLTSTSLFGTAFKMVFENSGPRPVFLTQLEVWGVPAKVASHLYVKVEDPTSIGDKDAYEEHPFEIHNDYIQDETAATTMGRMITQDKGANDDRAILLVKAVPQLQVGDVVNFNDGKVDEDYFVQDINGIFNDSGFRQKLLVTKRTINTYYRIGISTIGDLDDVLGP